MEKVFKYGDITSRIIKCSMNVHNELGYGFQEKIYQRALEIEMKENGLLFTKEQEMTIFYKGEKIGKRRVDFLVEGIICVELKASMHLEDSHIAQTLNYLEVYNLEIGVLINFGQPSLKFNRLTNKKFKQQNN